MRGKLVQIFGGLWPAHVWPACATRGHPLLGFWPSNLLAHLSRSSAVFGHPNSEFKSVFESLMHDDDDDYETLKNG